MSEAHDFEDEPIDPNAGDGEFVDAISDEENSDAQ